MNLKELNAYVHTVHNDRTKQKSNTVYHSIIVNILILANNCITIIDHACVCLQHPSRGPCRPTSFKAHVAHDYDEDNDSKGGNAASHNGARPFASVSWNNIY